MYRSELDKAWVVDYERHSVITDQQAEAAIDYLRDSAGEAAQARAEMEFLENMKSVIKSQIMAEHSGEPVNAQERFAYADPRYLTHLEGLKEAIYRSDRLKNLRIAAEARIEGWRSQSANLRGMTK